MPDVQLTMKSNKRPPKTSQHKRALSVLDRNNVKTPNYYNQLRMKNNQFMQGFSQGNDKDLNGSSHMEDNSTNTVATTMRSARD